MSGRAVRASVYAAVLAAFVLRHDFWWWETSRPLFGLPVGLSYHILFCVGVSLLMALLVRFAWPSVEP